MVLESTPLPRPQRLEGEPGTQSLSERTPRLPHSASAGRCEQRPLVSILVPAYNEASIICENLAVLCQYLERLEDEYRWELIVVNDGSRDDTGELAEAFAVHRSNVHIVHHVSNFGLGQALRTGFARCQGDYIITLDLDLSYSPDHIDRLLARIRQTGAKVVVTSPYMKGGKASNVPWLRLVLSVWANRFLSLAAKRNLSTLTGMVRVYDADFLKTLNLKSKGMDINPEVIHKTMLLDEPIEEIPAHLHWHSPAGAAVRTSSSTSGQRPKRTSSMKIFRHIWATFYYGFVFRPVMFFIIPSLLCFMLWMYTFVWVLIHCWTNYRELAHTIAFPDPTEAIALAFEQAPHTFFISGMLLMLAIQLFSLGVLAVQSKRYFEEVFYLGTAIYKSQRRGERRDR